MLFQITLCIAMLSNHFMEVKCTEAALGLIGTGIKTGGKLYGDYEKARHEIMHLKAGQCKQQQFTAMIEQMQLGGFLGWVAKIGDGKVAFVKISIENESPFELRFVNVNFLKGRKARWNPPTTIKPGQIGAFIHGYASGSRFKI